MPSKTRMDTALGTSTVNVTRMHWKLNMSQFDLKERKDPTNKGLNKDTRKGDLEVGLLYEPSGRFHYYVLYSSRRFEPISVPPMTCKPQSKPQIP